MPFSVADTMCYKFLGYMAHAVNELFEWCHRLYCREGGLEALLHGGNGYFFKPLGFQLLAFRPPAVQGHKCVEARFREFFHKPFHSVEVLCRRHCHCDFTTPIGGYRCTFQDLDCRSFLMRFKQTAGKTGSFPVDYLDEITRLFAQHFHTVL